MGVKGLKTVPTENKSTETNMAVAMKRSTVFDILLSLYLAFRNSAEMSKITNPKAAIKLSYCDAIPAIALTTTRASEVFKVRLKLCATK